MCSESYVTTALLCCCSRRHHASRNANVTYPHVSRPSERRTPECTVEPRAYPDKFSTSTLHIFLGSALAGCSATYEGNTAKKKQGGLYNGSLNGIALLWYYMFRISYGCRTSSS